MARLTVAARRKLPSSTFAGPGRSFPIPDKNHAKAALALIGHAPASARPHIRAVAERKLHSQGESASPQSGRRLHGSDKTQRIRMDGFKSHGLPYQHHTDHED